MLELTATSGKWTDRADEPYSQGQCSVFGANPCRLMSIVFQCLEFKAASLLADRDELGARSTSRISYPHQVGTKKLVDATGSIPAQLLMEQFFHTIFGIVFVIWFVLVIIKGASR